MHPIAATTGADGRKDIFWIDPNLGIRAARFRDQARVLGGNFVTVPAAIASAARRPIESTAERRSGVVPPPTPLDHRIDVFAVGDGYAMYQKTLWNDYTDDRGPWTSLGGHFASTPAVIATGDGRIHLFGVGQVDRALYRRVWNGMQWTTDWERLGGKFSGEPILLSTAPGKLDVFARGQDFTLRHRALDGDRWTTDWQNLGGSLASAPAVASPSPGRLDVVAVGHDGALWHRWQEAGFWNEWESLGGTFSSAPAMISLAPETLDVFVVGVPAIGSQNARDHRYPVSSSPTALRQFSYGGNSWGNVITLAEDVYSAPTVVSTAPGLMDLVAITGDRKLLWKQWNKLTWQDGGLSGYSYATDGPIQVPSRYQLSVDLVHVTTARTRLGADTDTIAGTVGAGNWPVQSATQFLNDLGGLTTPKEAQVVQLQFEVECELCDAVVFNYTVVNKGGSSSIEQAIKSQLTKTLGELTQAAHKQIVGDGLSTEAIVSIADGTSSEIFGTIFANDAGGFVVGTLLTWLTSQVVGLVFANCDGPVASAMMIIPGSQLQAKAAATGSYTTKTTHHTSGSPSGCLDSTYDVTWTLKRATHKIVI